MSSMTDSSAEPGSSSNIPAPMFKKRSSRPKGRAAVRSFVDDIDNKEASTNQITREGHEEEEERLSLEELIALRTMRIKPSGIELERLNKGEIKKKKKKKPEEKGGETEEDRWAQQMQRGGLVKRSAAGETSDQQKSKKDDEDEDEEEEEGKGSTSAPRLVKQNNFQGETGTVDVDKHMMAYIEEEMKKRRQRGELDSIGDAEKVKALLNPDDELYSVDGKYRKILQSAKEALEAAKKNVNGGVRTKEKDDQEEGNATLSSAMLNGVPEVDLGMDHRMKNIEETERAKRAMMEAQKVKNRDAGEEEEGDFASARFFKYGTKIQSDADILRRAEDVGLNEDGTAIEDHSRRQAEHKRQTATDDAALERFKKRQRNQLKR